jgi:serine/threonine protein kinase
MTPERWYQVKTVLCNALEIESEVDRQAYLTTASAGDPELRREVESLLEPQSDQVEAFADNLRATLGRRMWSDPIGQRLGAYRIVRELGRGGMGTVYLADRADGQFEKQVAVKLLKRGTDTDEILKRFQAERQILARLEHPNIAR